MKKVLIVNAYYYPGWRSGGPQQTVMNIVDVFGSQSRIHVLTHNHDMGEQQPYPGVPYDRWTDVGEARVFYSSQEKFSMAFLQEMSNQFDLVYLCGPYSDYAYKILLLNRMKKIKAQVVLAPMGSFSLGALSQKQLKKKVFWTAFKMLGLYRNILWSFTSGMEMKEAAACLGEKCCRQYDIAEDLPKRYVNLAREKMNHKKPGALKIVFLSRICPMKNLAQAVDIVARLDGDIQFDIYGTQEDQGYWKQCEQALSRLGPNVKWNYCGAVPAEKVIGVFLQYDVFLFPTLGENFGHVIYEALMAGCVPLLSDTTPWNDLEKNGCGCSIPLDDSEGYVRQVQQYVDMDGGQLSERSLNAMQYAEKKYQESVRLSGYSRIFI